MKKILFMQLFVLLAIDSFAQPIYSSVGGIETPYKDKYKFTAKLNEKTNTLSFETDAPVTKAVLGTHTRKISGTQRKRLHKYLHKKRTIIFL